MIPLSPALLIACASGRLTGRSSGAFLPRRDRLASFVPPAPGDEVASINFINSVGFWAHYDHVTGYSSWPLPHMDSVNALASYGRRAKVLFDRPRIGDLVVVWTPELNRFTRAGIVAALVGANGGGKRCLTLGARWHCGRARAARFRPSTGDRFLRWVNLERPALFGIPLSRPDAVAA